MRRDEQPGLAHGQPWFTVRLPKWFYRASARLIVAAVALFWANGLPAETPFLSARAAPDINEGFCANGTPKEVPPLKDVPNVRTWGSDCGDQGQKQTKIRTTVFAAPKYLQLYLSGYPAFPGINLWIERVQDGARIAIAPHALPERRWLFCEFALPAEWQGKQIRLVAEDARLSANWWIAFSEPLNRPPVPGWGEATQILLRTLEHFLLLMLPAAALCVLAVKKGLRDPVGAGAVALAATAVPGYLIFWLSLLTPRVAHAVAFLIPIAAIVLLWSSLRRIDFAGKLVLQTLLVPFSLVGAMSLLVISVGLVYGGLEDPSKIAANRFSHPLPPDNILPFRVSEAVRTAHMPPSGLGDWKSSDRPPLQSGAVLAQYPFITRPRELGYTILSVILQSLWLCALWLLLTALRLNSKAVTWALLMCAFSGFVFTNSFFVWPKLLAASYLLGFFALLFSGRLRRASQNGFFLSIVAAMLVTFSVLSHGGTIFALLGAIGAASAFRTPVALKHLLLMAGVSFALYLPWIGYQKFYDPPGDRLLKFHLAGVEHVDLRTFPRALADSYQELTFPQIVDHKLANFRTVASQGQVYWAGMAALVKGLFQGESASQLASLADFPRSRVFFYFFPTLGLSAFGLVAFLPTLFVKKLRSPEWTAATLFWLITAFSIVGWCLLMFGPSTTVIHQGAYATVLLPMAAGTLFLWALSPKLAMVSVVGQIGLNILLYGPLIHSPYLGGRLPEGQIRPVTLALATFSLLLAIFLFRVLSRMPLELRKSEAAAGEAVIGPKAII